LHRRSEVASKEVILKVAGHEQGNQFEYLHSRAFVMLTPYELMELFKEPTTTSPEDDRYEIKVHRGGTLFDSGSIIYVGGHDGSHHFYGFLKVAKDVPRHPHFTDMIAENLWASWFEAGDTLVVSRR
jgi:hypothetical protein